MSGTDRSRLFFAGWGRLSGSMLKRSVFQIFPVVVLAGEKHVDISHITVLLIGNILGRIASSLSFFCCTQYNP